MNVGPWQLLIVAVLILVLFGRGRISEMMGDFGKGIKSFKQGMNEEDRKDASGPAPRIEQRVDPAPAPAPAATVDDAATTPTPPAGPVSTPAPAENDKPA